MVALITLGITVIGGLGTLVKVMVDQLTKKLEENTTLTIQTKDVANGQLSIVIAQLATERNLVTGLRVVVRERDDRIAYIVARYPDVESLMIAYSDRRASHVTDSDMIAVEQHLLSNERPTRGPDHIA